MRDSSGPLNVLVTSAAVGKMGIDSLLDSSPIFFRVEVLSIVVDKERVLKSVPICSLSDYSTR